MFFWNTKSLSVSYVKLTSKAECCLPSALSQRNFLWQHCTPVEMSGGWNRDISWLFGATQRHRALKLTLHLEKEKRFSRHRANEAAKEPYLRVLH